MKWIDRLKRGARREPDARVEDSEAAGVPQAPEAPSFDVDPLKPLTPRERDVLFLLLQGKTMREAAEVLGVKQTTISFHSTSLYKKLDVHNRAQLILRYGHFERASNTLREKGADHG